jgi:hypothetical protein
MTHYTLNTGRTVAAPRSGVSREAIEALQPLIEWSRPIPGCVSLTEQGGPIPGRSPWRVMISRGTGCALFHVWRRSYPFFLAPDVIVECGLAWTGEGEVGVWPAVEKIYLDLGDLCPKLFTGGEAPWKPTSLPWLAVVYLPVIPELNQSRDDIGWVEDFERSLAWTILARQ